MNILYITLKKRFLYTLIASLIFVLTYYIGSIAPLNEEYSSILREEFKNIIQNINYLSIFLNNFRITLGMFIPGIGAVIGLYAAYNTGLVYQSFAQTSPQLASIPSLLILLTPFGILEIFSYSLAISQSIILLKAIINKKLDKNLLYSTLIQVGMVALILFIAAIIEYYMIKELGGINIT